MYKFSIVTNPNNIWQEMESWNDFSIFHSKEWGSYLRSTNYKTIVVLIQDEENEPIGYFIGTKRWVGITVIGAPAGGAGTYVQGLCMKYQINTYERVQLYQALANYLIGNHIASYIQISDWTLRHVYDEFKPYSDLEFPILVEKGITHVLRATLFVDTKQSEEILWSNLRYKSCKYSINKAHKEGLKIRIIEDVKDIPAFVDKLSSLIENVSDRKKEKRHKHHSKKNLLALCNALFPNRIIMIQVLGELDGAKEEVLSSAIFCIGGNVSTYFSGASNKAYMKYCPNELMVWEGMKMLHQKGGSDMIMGGTADYKKKFGSQYAYLPMMVFSRYQLLLGIRARLKRFYSIFRNKGK